jgi:hypothetical protein
VRLTGASSLTFSPALPMPYPALANAGVRFRRSQTSLTVAAPGAGKSQLWGNLAQRMKVPTLYWSADTDRADATARTIALWLGYPVTEVEEALSQPDVQQRLFYELGTVGDHVEWVFDPAVTGRGLGERLNGFAELHGEYPHLVVVDNLSNAITDPQNEYAQIKEVMAAGQKLARDADCHIAFLHHAKGEYEDGTKPVPLGGASQNPFKVVEVGLTLHRPAGRPDLLGINAVKLRNGGESDRAATKAIYLPIDFSRGMVLDYRKDI